MRRTVHMCGLLALAGAFVIGGSAAAVAKPKYTPKVSVEQARTTALAQVPGTVVEEELESEKKRWIWEFEIRPSGGGRLKEVAIDAETGAVVSIDGDEDGDEDGDDGDDDDDDDDGGPAAAKKRSARKR